jgi:hypothetical protein
MVSDYLNIQDTTDHVYFPNLACVPADAALIRTGVLENFLEE